MSVIWRPKDNKSSVTKSSLELTGLFVIGLLVNLDLFSARRHCNFICCYNPELTVYHQTTGKHGLSSKEILHLQGRQIYRIICHLNNEILPRVIPHWNQIISTKALRKPLYLFQTYICHRIIYKEDNILTKKSEEE